MVFLQKSYILNCFVIILCNAAVISSKIESKIYFKINKYQPCVQLANATHQIGCTSKMKGNRGIIHLVNFEKDVDWLINVGQHPPYIPLIDAPMFTERTMRKLVDSKKVSGALVILKNSSITQPFRSNSLPSHPFSPDPSCPLDRFGFYSDKPEYSHCKKVEWNQHGNGMSMEYYGIPIFSLSDSVEIEQIKKCATKYNFANGTAKTYPLCQIELKDFMFAAKDTPTCKRKSVMANPIMSTYCDPLGDDNVFGTLYPLVEEVKNDSVIMISARLDSTGFFHDLAPGGDNGVTGIVTLLAVARALGDYKRKKFNETLKPIMFSFFNGEVWDYIGSSRMVWDMEKGTFPYAGNRTHAFNGSINDFTSMSKINISNIGYFIELTQLGLGHDAVFAHSDPISQKSKSVREKVDKIMSAFNNSGIPFMQVDRKLKQPLPPASFQRFLRSRKDIPGVVLADHAKVFANKFYNSRYDNGENLRIGIRKSRKSLDYREMNGSLPSDLTKLSEAVANAIYSLASGGKTPKAKIVVPKNLTAGLLYCMMYSANCSRFQEISDKSGNQLPSVPYQRYVSIQNMDNPITHIIHRLLSYYTGEWMKNCTGKKASRLPQVLSYYNVQHDGSYICVKSTAYMTPAVSPAFELENYTSTEYSTWTESMWSSEMGIQMYLVADPTIEGVILASGIVMVIVSFGLVFFMKKKASILFTPTPIVIIG